MVLIMLRGLLPRVTTTRTASRDTTVTDSAGVAQSYLVLSLYVFWLPEFLFAPVSILLALKSIIHGVGHRMPALTLRPAL